METEWSVERSKIVTFEFVKRLVVSTQLAVNKIVIENGNDIAQSNMNDDVITLLTVRYEHDYIQYKQLFHTNQQCINDARGYTIVTDNKVNTNDDNTMNKITALVSDQFVPRFINGFIQSNATLSPSLQSIVKGWSEDKAIQSGNELYSSLQYQNGEAAISVDNSNETTVCNDDNANFTSDNAYGNPRHNSATDVLANRISILNIKLCDYIEDVFLFLAQSSIEKEKQQRKTIISDTVDNEHNDRDNINQIHNDLVGDCKNVANMHHVNDERLAEVRCQSYHYFALPHCPPNIL